METREIDLRSDTKTRPGPDMRRAIAAAEVGDDESGEDPTVNALQERVAGLLGKEAAMWFPTGTMSNQVGVRAQCASGDEIICHQRSHLSIYEMGGAAALAGVQLRGFDSEDGTLPLETVEPFIQTDEDADDSVTRMIALENTHNACGGLVLDPQHALAVRALCDRRGLRLHLDGARLWNAHIASRTPLDELAAPFDTINVCFSKGLGAPAGSMLVGDGSTIRRALRYRLQFGGAMRQVGVLAAAGLWALDNNLQRLADDHARARRFAGLLAEIPGVEVDPERVHTNMVFAQIGSWTSREAEERLAKHGLLADGTPWKLRFVWHLDRDDADVEAAANTVRAALRD
ncbi:MAG: GntG family PLP-dependent aldolase [Actinomycetota bacterium]